MKTLTSNNLKNFIFCIAIAIFCTSCAPNKIIANKVGKEFKNSAIIDEYQVGFALYDMGKREMIFQKDADKYYTPASNTKLFTFYAGLKMMPDSIPSLRYVEKGDSLIFWGTGDPSFLHKQLKGTKAYNFLKHANKKLFYAPGRYTGAYYGDGWAWDDYNAYYQAEINDLPLFDNLVMITANKVGGMDVLPHTFSTCFVKDSVTNTTSFSVKRNLSENEFIFTKAPIGATFKQEVPYKVSDATTINLLTDTLNKFVGLVKMVMPAEAKTIYNLPSDTVFKQMLLPSDNFIAEQLLLAYGNNLGGSLSAEKTISYVTKNFLSALPDRPQWVDGSGLSRQNLFTPRAIIKLLTMIYDEVGNQDKLFAMLPSGGKAGTLRNAYPKTDNPFVFAKTGTLTNIHNQSGFVTTKKGKTYAFSFMNNSFVAPTADVRNEMVRIMTYIHENF